MIVLRYLVVRARSLQALEPKVPGPPEKPDEMIALVMMTSNRTLAPHLDRMAKEKDAASGGSELC
jgi:hypothetical protein